MKIKPEAPKDFNAFEIEVNEVEYKTMCWMIDTYQDYIEQGKNPPFSYYGDIVLKCTELSEEQLNKYSNHEIRAMGQQIFLESSKKK